VNSGSRPCESDEPASGSTTARAHMLGARLGRHHIVGELGRGAMGRVYLAWDPYLEREVAIKILHEALGGEQAAHSRLQREANALARLSHPNAVEIFDVQAVTPPFFIVMEYVPGTSLHEWLVAEPREWRSVLDAFLQAARGLAAAHAAGLVHRDFKPQNVLLRNDGCVKVTDFGLARSQGSLDGGSGSLDAGILGEDITRSGTAVGTPVYMAPEQHRGEAADARSDQYAFCVALYEALAGRRPFEQRSLDALLEAKERGQFELERPADGRPTVPRRIVAAVVRGLSPKPTDRWPSMDALVEALSGERTRAPRFLLSCAGTLAIVGLWLAARGGDPCEAGGKRIAEAWSDSRRAEVHQAIVGTGVAHASDTWTLVHSELDAYAARWVASHADACRGAVDERQATSMLDARMQCLTGRRRSLEALIDTLARADVETVRNAAQAVHGLPPVDACEDPTYVLSLAPPPDDPVVRTRVETLRERLAVARASRIAGHPHEGLSIVRRVMNEAEASGHPPLAVEAADELGRLQEDVGSYEDAVATLRAVHFEAMRLGLDEIAAASAAKVTFVLGTRLGRPDEALEWARHAQAEVERVDLDDIRASLMSGMGAAHLTRGEYPEAAELIERALAIRERSAAENPRALVEPINNLAAVHFATGAYDEAAALLERALYISERTLGPRHPEIALVLNNLATAHVRVQSYDEALALVRRALVIQQDALGPDHPDVAELLATMAFVHGTLGQHAEAKTLDEQALRIFERALGPDHPSVGLALNNLANRHGALGDQDEARRLLERAVAILEATRGPDHPEAAQVVTNLALVHQTSGSLEVAEQLYARALETLEAALLPEHPHIAFALAGLAEIALADGRLEEARARAERALALRESGRFPAYELAESRFTLARVLAASGETAQAIALAELARDDYAMDRDAEALAEVEAWLAGARE
jgi:eukaryotic-like serine/threonine-protein kinase